MGCRFVRLDLGLTGCSSPLASRRRATEGSAFLRAPSFWVASTGHQKEPTTFRGPNPTKLTGPNEGQDLRAAMLSVTFPATARARGIDTRRVA